MRKLNIVLGIIVVAMMAVWTTGAGAKPMPVGDNWHANGNPDYFSGAGLRIQRHFDVQWNTVTGFKGNPKVQTMVTDPTTHQKVRNWEGNVTCFVPIADNEVVFAGQVTKDKDHPQESVAGQYYTWHVIDNGNKKDQPSDMIGAQLGPTPNFADCNNPPAATQPLTKGQIHVMVTPAH